MEILSIIVTHLSLFVFILFSLPPHTSLFNNLTSHSPVFLCRSYPGLPWYDLVSYSGTFFIRLKSFQLRFRQDCKMVFSSLSPTTTGTTTRPPMSPRHKFKKQHHHDPRKLCDKAKSCPVESSCTLTSTGTSNSRSKNESKNERNHCTSAKAKKSARINEFQNTVHEYQAVPLHLYSHVWYDHHETEDMLEEMKSTLELYAQFPDLIDEGHSGIRIRIRILLRQVRRLAPI